ncbi:macrosialin [Ambystoma mexicanum]|uniref:macrosialin n=1 Tax=Ambystoma mexicanum TaxID=8296 RepID=UPI0037E86C44
MEGTLSRCLAFTILLALASSAQDNECCPPHKKTTTTTHRTTTPQTTTRPTTPPHTNHTTAHTTANHTTANHTSAPHTTANHTSAPHTTNHTTANHTSAPHTTNHTSAPYTTANHTTAHTTANYTTANYTSKPYTTSNHTSAPHTTATYTTDNTTATHTTNHTVAPSTTLVPTINPDVVVGDYTVKNGSEICLRAKMGLKLLIQYNITGGRQIWGSVIVPGPDLTIPSGFCYNETAILKLSFPAGFVQFTFHKNTSKQYVYLSDVFLSINQSLPQSKETSFGAHNSSLHELETVTGRSYQCKNLTIQVSRDVLLNMVQPQIQAFQLQDGQFGRSEHCPADQPSMVVPIIVGVILAVLIVIVVVAYLIGRRRSHGGYQSI